MNVCQYSPALFLHFPFKVNILKALRHSQFHIHINNSIHVDVFWFCSCFEFYFFQCTRGRCLRAPSAPITTPSRCLHLPCSDRDPSTLPAAKRLPGRSGGGDWSAARRWRKSEGVVEGKAGHRDEMKACTETFQSLPRAFRGSKDDSESEEGTEACMEKEGRRRPWGKTEEDDTKEEGRWGGGGEGGVTA